MKPREEEEFVLDTMNKHQCKTVIASLTAAAHCLSCKETPAPLNTLFRKLFTDNCTFVNQEAHKSIKDDTAGYHTCC